MLKKIFGFGKKNDLIPVPSAPVLAPSKGYHSCVDTCEKDIENLETECENLRKDNITLMSKVGVLENNLSSANKEGNQRGATILELQGQVKEKDERIEELEKRLEEADQRNEGTPVKYASARKTLTKAKLASLRKALEAAPSGAQGFGGSCSIYDKKTKRVSLVEFKSREEALALVEKAEKGNVDIIM
jgi:predicted RNase H-like nuclease (RuvC/YqgF family)